MARHPVPLLLAVSVLLAAGIAGATGAAADPPGAAPGRHPAAALQQALAAADAALRGGEPEQAESHYRSALLEGWLLAGALELEAEDLPAARAALLRAATVAVETRRALTALAVVQLQLGESEAAVSALRAVAARHPGDRATRRLLAQALVTAGRPEQAVQELEELRGAAPDDPELAFSLASGYLRLGRLEPAERLFSEVLAARPGAPTLVLIGRAYRDAKWPQRAAAAFTQALRVDPRVRRARYYLGTLALLDEDGPRLDEAIVELQRELAHYPEDDGARLYLGMALVEAKRLDEALAPLSELAGQEAPQVEALFYLGRCLLGLDRPHEAAAALRRALALAPAAGTDDRRVHGIHYQLALALRRQGAASEAAAHFAAAERLSAELAERSRQRLARYLEDVPEPLPPSAALGAFTATSLDALGAAERQALRREVHGALARAYFNLAVPRLQAGEPARALELLAPAAELDPALPGLQRALGIAQFNARHFAAAIAPLEGALALQPADLELRRLLALARLETGAYGAAAELLAGDSQRAADPALQYAYALALVRSGQAAAAQEVFADLLREHGDWPQLHVLLGQAHAAESDFEAAVAALQRALALSPQVPEAHATLGSIYLRQGRLAEAERELRAELLHRPGDATARYQLATVLELADRQEEAMALLRSLLAEQPEFADGRYLLGKMLLARGDPAAAAFELEAAARLAPNEANIAYQLALAYQKLGHGERAQQQLARYRELKRAERDGSR